MKISHRITIGFLIPTLLAGILSHIYMAKCQETGREQERIFLSAIASLSELERTKLKDAGQPASEAARQSFTQARSRFNAFMRMVEYSQYAFMAVLLLLLIYTLKTILLPVRNMATAALRLREGHLGVKVPVSANDELGSLAKAFNSMSAGLKEREEQMRLSNRELQEALTKIKTLHGLLPICASCKSIRDDYGYWHKVEIYLSEHSDLKFTHGLCEVCIKKLYPQLAEEEKNDNSQVR